MVMLCGVCVWHAVVGAAAVRYHVTDDHAMLPEVTSWPDTTPSRDMTSSSPNATGGPPTVCSMDLAAQVEQIRLADNMALATFSSLYLAFHVVLVARICTSVSSQLHPRAYARETCPNGLLVVMVQSITCTSTDNLTRLSVLVQVIDWKDSSPKRPIMC